MQSVYEFRKAFKLAIPHPPELDYYLGLLRQSPEFADLDDCIDAWLRFEESQDDGSIKKARMKYQSRMIERLNGDLAYRAMQSLELTTKFSQKSLGNGVSGRGRILLSMDLVKANYSMLRKMERYYAHQDGMDSTSFLPDTWEKLCQSQHIPEALIKSKSFRQIVFGNLNPKRSQRIQLSVIYQLMEFLGDALLPYEQMMLSPDELIIDINPYVGLMGMNQTEEGAKPVLYLPLKITQLLDRIDAWNADNEDGRQPQVRVSFFQLQLIGDEPGEIKTHYVRDTDTEVLHESHRSLFAVPGNRFYMNFKKHILNQALDPRDLLFVNEGHLARWII